MILALFAKNSVHSGAAFRAFALQGLPFVLHGHFFGILYLSLGLTFYAVTF